MQEFVISAKEVMFFTVCVFLPVIRITQKTVMNFDDIFGGVGCVNRNSWLDFGGDMMSR